MKKLSFLVVGKNQEILDTLKRIIENNDGWLAELRNDELTCYEYLEMHPVDIILLSSGLDDAFEKDLKEYIYSSNKGTKVIDHYGGGSGLLKNEVFQLFPEWNV